MQAPNLIGLLYSISANNAVRQANASTPSNPVQPHEPATFASSLLHPETYERLLTHFIDYILKNSLKTGLVVAVALIIEFVIEWTIRRVCALARQRHSGNLSQHKKIDTLQSILLSVVRYVVTLAAMFKVLILWGVSPQTLTVGSAILAGAVGFGSQGLVQDMITGFGLLFEDQLQVGDYVQIGDKTGYVREVGLRVVKLEALDGTEHIIFNRQITTVSNLKTPAVGTESK